MGSFLYQFVTGSISTKHGQKVNVESAKIIRIYNYNNIEIIETFMKNRPMFFFCLVLEIERTHKVIPNQVISHAGIHCCV